MRLRRTPSRVYARHMPIEALLSVTEYERSRAARDHELVRGRLVPVTPVSPGHGEVAVLLASRLSQFVRERAMGRVFVETGFVLARVPGTVRGPDVSFISSGHPGYRAARGFIDGPPDLAVEIRSPGDSRRALLDKGDEYVAAGTRLVWLLDPEAGRAWVVSPDAQRHELGPAGALDGGTVIPGFTIPLREILADAPTA